MNDWESLNRVFGFEKIVSDGDVWLKISLQMASATAVGGASHLSFMKNRDMTREALAKRLYDACKIVHRQQHYIKFLENQAQHLKSDVIAHQGNVLELQKDLLAAKDQQLNDLRASVVTSVEDTVKAEFQSYSDIVKQSSSSAAGTLLDQKTLKTVVKDVVAEEDRSRNLMIFGLTEETEEQLHDKVSNVLLELGEKPKIEVCRIGVEKSGTKQFARPVKVSVSSPTIVQQVLSKARKLRNSEQYGHVFISPDRTAEQRAEQKKLVQERKKKATDEPNKRHFIKEGKVCSVDK